MGGADFRLRLHSVARILAAQFPRIVSGLTAGKRLRNRPFAGISSAFTFAR